MAENFGLVDRVWTLANPSNFSGTTRTSLIYCPVGRCWDLHRGTVPASCLNSRAVFDWSARSYLCPGSRQCVIVALQSCEGVAITKT
jgi:hypothetical protein